MRKTVGRMLLLTGFTVGVLAGCGNSYEEQIDEVLEQENASLQEPGVEKDIDGVTRDTTVIDVYQDGDYILLTYEIRDGDEISSLYERQGEEYEDIAYANNNEDMIQSLEPEYTSEPGT